jgi:hypothetical protein
MISIERIQQARCDSVVSRASPCVRIQRTLLLPAMGGCLFLFACGGALDPNFSGTWTGEETLSLENVGSYKPDEVQFVVTVNGNTAMVQSCGGATETFTGSGDSISWSGSVACPPVSFSGTFNCPSVVMTYRNARGNLTNNTLTSLTTGNAAGCGASHGFTLVFSGTK